MLAARASAKPMVPLPKVVCIFLRGAIDLLAQLAPYGNSNYVAHRSFTLLKPPGPGLDEAVDLNGTFGVPKYCLPLQRTPWTQGKLAYFLQAGSPLDSFSHFVKQDAMELGHDPSKLGQPGYGNGDGWIGRYLTINRSGSNAKAPRGVAIAPRRPLSFARGPYVVVTPALLTYAFPGPNVAPRNAAPTVQSMYNATTDPLKTVGKDAFDGFDFSAALNAAGYTPLGGATYPSSYLGQSMKSLAWMYNTSVSGWAPEVAHIDQVGYDSHDHEDLFYGSDGSVGLLLDDLSKSLEAFYIDMTAHGTPFLVIAMSEFGRRPKENGSQGTDHGAGGVMIAMGDSVIGGIYGQIDWPSGGPDPNYNFPVNIDYRSVIGEALIKKFNYTQSELSSIVFDDPTFVYTEKGYL
jgi:uncharacterized protein (DUF1501 family)